MVSRTLFHRMLLLTFLFGLLLIGGAADAPAEAQLPSDQTCPNLVTLALEALEENCTGIGRNSACYGYDLVRASFNDSVPEDFFTLPSDTSGLTALSTLRTAPLDPETGRWGISLINAQANVPNTLPGQAVTFLLLGDTEIENRVDPADAVIPVEPVLVTVRVNGGANVRSGPSTNFNRIGVIQDGTQIGADGRNEAGDWLRIGVDNQPGWISRSLTLAEDESLIDALPVMSEESFTPMQAFYFSTGIGQSICNEAPDALVIQGPQELQVNLEINGAEITIGSTVVLQSYDPDGPGVSFESPFGESAPTVLLEAGAFVYPVDGQTLRISGGGGGGVPVSLNEGVFLHPVDAAALLITPGIDDQTGINNQGGVSSDGETLFTNIPIEEIGGAMVTGRVFIAPAPGGGILLSAENGDLSGLGGTPVMPGGSGPSTPGCRTNELIVLDGHAMLNDDGLNLPIGHRATSQTCFDENGEIADPPDWKNKGEVPQDELRQRFSTLERIPPSVLRYPIRIPTEDEIRRAISTPTPQPRPTQSGGGAVPTEEVGEPVSGVDCSAFRGTSPTGGMTFGFQQFYWDPAPGADLYRVIVQATDRPGQVSGDVAGGTTNLTLDLGVGALNQFGRGYDFQWFVQAFLGGTFACQTEPIFQNRQAVSDDALCKMLGGSWDGACYGRNNPYDTDGDGIIEMPW